MQIENKTLYTSLAAAALVALAAFAVIGRWDSRTGVRQSGGQQASSTGQAPDGTGSSTVRMEIATLSSSTPVYVIRAEYPRFPDLPDLTRQVDAFVAEQSQQFAKNATDNWEARNATLRPGETPTDFQFSLDLTWQPAQVNGRYVSFLMRVDAFEGGANVRQELQAFNWDSGKNQEATLASLFGDDPSYLARVSAYARQVLKANLGDSTTDAFLDDGTKPAIASFKAFTFTDDAISLFFPKYQVAPGAAGEQRVVMPRNIPGLF